MSTATILRPGDAGKTCRKVAVPEDLTEDQCSDLMMAGVRATQLARDLAHGGKASLEAIARGITVLLETDGWKRRVIVPMDGYGNMLEQPEEGSSIIEFDSFEQFVTCPQLEGLGETVQSIKNLMRDDRAALDLIDRAMQRGDGGDNNPHGQKGKPEGITVDVINSDSRQHRPTGTSIEAALRRLRKDRPDLHARVIARNLMNSSGAIPLYLFWFLRQSDR